MPTCQTMTKSPTNGNKNNQWKLFDRSKQGKKKGKMQDKVQQEKGKKQTVQRNWWNNSKKGRNGIGSSR